MASQCQILPSKVTYWTYSILQAVPSIILLFCPGTWELWIYWGCFLCTNSDCMMVGFTILLTFKANKSILLVTVPFWGECRVCHFGQCNFLCVCFHTVKTKNSLHNGAIVKPWILRIPTFLKMEDRIWPFLHCNVLGVRLVWLDVKFQNISSSSLLSLCSSLLSPSLLLCLLLSTAGTVSLKIHHNTLLTTLYLHTHESSNHFMPLYIFFICSCIKKYV